MKTIIWLPSIACLVLIATVSRPLPAQEILADNENGIVTHMHEYLARITEIKALIIMGNLDGVREPAATVTWSTKLKLNSATTGCRQSGPIPSLICNAINGRRTGCGRA